jgi:hypothetical protein
MALGGIALALAGTAFGAAFAILTTLAFALVLGRHDGFPPSFSEKFCKIKFANYSIPRKEYASCVLRSVMTITHPDAPGFSRN